MVNSELLNQKIDASGLKINYILEQIGISANGFDKKRKNKTPFRTAEIYVLCDLLKLDNSEKQAIFFAK